jgi:hypothetical protein
MINAQRLLRIVDGHQDAVRSSAESRVIAVDSVAAMNCLA